MVDSTVWSWVSPLIDGRTLLQSADGQLWDGIPHPYGWDRLERIEIDSLEPLMATRVADGWWVLGIEGHLDHMTTNSEEVRVGEGMDLGDLLVRLGPNSMVTCRRDGLIRRWVAPHLAEQQRRHRQKEAADAKLARSWDERRQLFERAQTAEDEGRLSRAVELYEALGEWTMSNDCCDVRKEVEILNPDETLTIERVNHYLSITAKARDKATSIASNPDEESMLNTLLSMADNYANDAQYFLDQGDLIRAFGAINYAHAWIDAGVKLRLLDGHGDDVLFTLP